MTTADVNGTTLFYETVGNGPACLVMHGGLGLDHTVYRTLNPLAGHLRLVYYDHRSNGRSGRPPIETLTMEQLADDAAALAGHLGEERVVVFGHSYGGFVAQEFALRHPDRLSALVLCSTTPGQLGTGEPAEESEGPPPPPEFIEMISSPPASDDDYAAAMTQLFPLFWHNRDLMDGVSLDDAILSREASDRGFEVLSRWSSVDRLSTITAPTLVPFGTHDVFTAPPQSHRIARRIPGAETVEFTSSGHLPWLEEPRRFFEVVTGWLERVGVRAGTSSG